MNEIVKKNGLTYGVILGVLSVLITAIIYVVDMSLFTSWWLGLVIILINIVFFIVALTATKKQLNGVMSFKEAFTTFFLVCLVGLTISTVFNYLLFNVIDPEAKEVIRDHMIKASSEMMAKFGAPQADVDKAIAEMEETDNYSPANLAKGWAFSLAFSALFGLLFALIFRSKPAYKE